MTKPSGHDRPPSCYGLLLAAGFSRRFGDDKRLQPIATQQSSQKPSAAAEPLGLVTVKNWLEACAGNNRLAHLYVVTRPGDAFFNRLQAFIDATLPPPPCTLLTSSDAELGMGHTLAQAVAQIPPGALIVGLADMPFVQPTTLRALVAAVADSPLDGVVQPTYDKEPGNPVGFGAALRPALARSEGDEGARARVREARVANRLAAVRVDDAGILYDIDTPADLASRRSRPNDYD